MLCIYLACERCVVEFYNVIKFCVSCIYDHSRTVLHYLLLHCLCVNTVHVSQQNCDSLSFFLLFFHLYVCLSCFFSDLYFTRVMPSKQFDLLAVDFDYRLISAVVLGMAAATVVLSKLASRKTLKAQWK